VTASAGAPKHSQLTTTSAWQSPGRWSDRDRAAACADLSVACPAGYGAVRTLRGQSPAQQYLPREFDGVRPANCSQGNRDARSPDGGRDADRQQRRVHVDSGSECAQPMSSGSGRSGFLAEFVRPSRHRARHGATRDDSRAGGAARKDRLPREGEIPKRIEPVKPRARPLPQGQDQPRREHRTRIATPSAEESPTRCSQQHENRTLATTRPLDHPTRPLDGTGTTRVTVSAGSRPAPIRDHRASGADSRPPGGEGRNETSSRRGRRSLRPGVQCRRRAGANSRPMTAAGLRTRRSAPARDQDAFRARPRRSTQRSCTREGTPSRTGCDPSGRPRRTPRDSDPHDPAAHATIARPSPAARTADAAPGTRPSRRPSPKRGFPTSTARSVHRWTLGATNGSTGPAPVAEPRSAGHPVEDARSAAPADETVRAPHSAELTRSEQPVTDQSLGQAGIQSEHTTVDDRPRSRSPRSPGRPAPRDGEQTRAGHEAGPGRAGAADADHDEPAGRVIREGRDEQLAEDWRLSASEKASRPRARLRRAIIKRLRRLRRAHGLSWSGLSARRRAGRAGASADGIISWPRSSSRSSR